jgi:hypothetical protein
MRCRFEEAKPKDIKGQTSIAIEGTNDTEGLLLEEMRDKRARWWTVIDDETDGNGNKIKVLRLYTSNPDP